MSAEIEPIIKQQLKEAVKKNTFLADMSVKAGL